MLIIGGTGFIGRWIVRALVEHAHEVRVFHRGRTTAALPRSVAHIHGERAELPRFAPLFRAWAPDVVLDTFAYDRDDLVLVARATEEIPCRLVLLSSMDVYRAYGIYCRLEEGAPDTRMFDENAPLRSVLYPYRKNAASVDDLLYRYDKIPAEFCGWARCTGREIHNGTRRITWNRSAAAGSSYQRNYPNGGGAERMWRTRRGRWPWL